MALQTAAQRLFGLLSPFVKLFGDDPCGLRYPLAVLLITLLEIDFVRQ